MKEMNEPNKILTKNQMIQISKKKLKLNNLH